MGFLVQRPPLCVIFQNSSSWSLGVESNYTGSQKRPNAPSSMVASKNMPPGRLAYYGAHDPNDLFEPTNFAIVCSYAAVGIVSSFISTPLNIYMVEVLNAEPKMQNTIGILSTLPWSLKLVFGFLSDAVPIFGMNRKPYLIAGCLLYSASFILYGLSAAQGVHNTAALSAAVFFGTMGLIMFDVMTDTMCVERSKFEPDESRGQMQASCYSIRFAGCVLGAILGTVVSNKDVHGMEWIYLDFAQVSFLNGIIPFFLVAPWVWQLKEQYVPKEKDSKGSSYSGELEAGNSSSNSNNVLSVQTSEARLQQPGTVRSWYGSTGSTDKGSALAPSVLPVDFVAHSVQSSNNDSREERMRTPSHMKYTPISAVLYSEDEEQHILQGLRSQINISAQINEIWQTVQLQAVWRPMAFVFVFNLFQIPNVAWQSYLQLTLHFEPWILGLTVTLGSFMTFFGIVAYKYFFFKASWRSIYLYSAVLTAFFSLLQLVLIFQVNVKMGLSNYLFSLGDDVISQYISGIQFLPVCIMYMRLCPEGAEGSSYAMLTTFGNIALVVACSVGNLFAGIWDVSNDTLRAGNVDGLWRLSILTSLSSLLPLSLLFLLPKNPAEQDELSKSSVRSVTGGVIFLTVLFVSLFWSISRALFEVWSG